MYGEPIENNLFPKLQHVNSGSENKFSLIHKNLPVSVDAERALLSSMLLNPSIIDRIMQDIRSEDFYVSSHKILCNRIFLLREKHTHIDLMVLKDELEKFQELEKIGGVQALMLLQEDIATLSFVDQHVQIVKEKSFLRSIINAATSIINQCYLQNDEGVAAVVDHAERLLFEIGSKKKSNSFIQLDLWLKKTFVSLLETQSSEKGITGVAAGYYNLDAMTSGFQAGDFVVLAARPSMGKSALAMCIARNAAQNGQGIGVISLEMSAEQLTLRLLACEARVKLSSIRNGTIDSQDWMALTNAAAQLASYKIFIDDTPLQTVLDVRTKARKLKTDSNIGLLIIDYLQLLHSNRKHENRHQEVSEISRFLKALAKELNIPVIALSQLSRTVDSRADKRPMLSDLRDSGAIEQDADLILFLYRDVVYNPETPDPQAAEIIIGKQRNGPTGTVVLQYQGEYTLFEDQI